MRMIPVLDLLDGQVVHAVRGARGTYQPVQSKLCPTSQPLAVARAMVAAYGVDTLYLVDLDAVLGRPSQRDLLGEVIGGLPQMHWWLDGGFADRSAGLACLVALGAGADRVTPVFGSETMRDAAALRQLCEGGEADRRRFVLSLDRRDGQPMDPAGCWTSPTHWPDRVIAMTLERVGTGAGPDLATLGQVRSLRQDVAVIGAGGIRDAADLAAAQAAGASGWLVASALHDGRLQASPSPQGAG